MVLGANGWDFLTDYSGVSFATYMQAEKNVGSSWPSDGKSDHWGLIRTQLNLLDSSLFAKWTDAARGNIFDGTPTRGTP